MAGHSCGRICGKSPVLYPRAGVWVCIVAGPYTCGTASYIHDVICYINQHYNEELTVEDIAAKFFISRSKLTSDFKSFTGTTIHQLVNEIRINQAVYIMHYKNWSSIQEIAERVGMGDGSQFYVVFKKLTGLSPLQYAKRIHQTEI